MKIQCLIERDGPTSVVYCGVRYDFVKNEHGHYVCDMPNPGAAKYFLTCFNGEAYREYIEPVAPIAPEPKRAKGNT